MITLRTYQKEQIRLVRESFSKGHKKIIVASPTGSGKTILISEMVRASFDKGKRIYILTHRIELFKSVLAHISKQNIPCFELKAGMKMPPTNCRVLVCMEKTLWNRIRKQGDEVLRPDIILADEIHFNNFTKIINHFSDSFLIGYSATPIGKHIYKTYSDIIQTVDVPDLIESGHLCKIKAWQMDDAEDGEFDKMKITKGEFDNKELFNHYNKNTRYAGVFEGYKEKVFGLKGIVFCVNVAHTIKTFETFKEGGVNAFMVHSKMSDEERNYNVREFESSSDGVMINCGILTVGYNHAPIRFVIQDFATTSIAKFLQTIGRGSRKYDGKNIFFCLDYGRNHERHGLWNQERKWSLEPPKKKKKGIVPIKACPQCGAMLHARSIKCEFCGYVFITDNQSALKNGVLVEVGNNKNKFEGRKISELSIQELVQLSKTKKIKTPYIWRVVRAKGYDAVQNYGWLMGYKNGWAFNQQKELNDCSFRDRIL